MNETSLRTRNLGGVILTIMLLCAIGIGEIRAQLIVTDASVLNNWNADSLVRNVLLDNGVTISNAKFNGEQGVIHCDGIGKFETGSIPTNIGMESGLILSSGSVYNAIGPNNEEGMGSSSSCVHYYDNDLASIASHSINDLAVLEFDFVPWDNTVTFSYVFGSEEYMEYANSIFNDVFGFFVEGINPEGGYYDHHNVALIPGTTEVVSINNVNLYHNPDFYIDNAGGSTIQFDGFTTLLEVSFNVVPMTDYHIKLAICDVSDDVLDSGVFLKAHSFTTNFSHVMTIDDMMYNEIPDNHFFCSDKEIEFNTVTNWNYDNVVWYFGDGTAAYGEQVTHTYDAEGLYTVTNVIHNPHRATDSIYLTKVIEVRSLDIEEHVTACDSYHWHGTTYTEDGTYTRIVHNPGTCDSTQVLHLTLSHSFHHDTTAFACNAFTWHGTTYTESGSYTLVNQTAMGCDSIHTLNLTLDYSPRLLIDGLTQVAITTDLGPFYTYYTIDTLGMESCELTWTCSNPDWLLFTTDDPYQCLIAPTTLSHGTLTLTAQCHPDCDAVGTIEINATPYGVADPKTDDAGLFPNPAHTQVTVKAPRLTRIRMLNTCGKALKDIANRIDEECVTIDVSDVLPGVYFMEITTALGCNVKPLIIMR